MSPERPLRAECVSLSRSIAGDFLRGGDMVARNTMQASELVKVLQSSIEQYGDRPVFFTDGFHRHGLTCHAESAPNFDSPKAMLVKAFSLDTGIDGPREPMKM